MQIEQNSRVAIAVMAAGSATRFGGRKLESMVNDRPLLHFALEAAQRACPNHVHVVVGDNSDAVSDLAERYADAIHLNTAYRNGIGSSIARAASACRDTYDAMIVALADQPLISAEHLRNLITTNAGRRDRIAISQFNGTCGPPALFGSGFFDKLCELDGDEGARAIARLHRHATDEVPFEPAAIDIDTQSDFDALAMRLSAAQSHS